MNQAKIIIGGLAAGVVMNIIDFVVNALLLGPQWEAGMKALNIDPAKMEASGMGWIAVDFVIGLVIVWLYALCRPRLGPGPKTAMTAALVVWIISAAMTSSFWFMSLFPGQVVALSTLGGFVAAQAGGYVGGMLYKEE